MRSRCLKFLGFSNYYVDEDGTVYGSRGKMHPWTNTHGYKQVRLCNGISNRRVITVHRLVALAFLSHEIVRTTEGMHINHKDGNKSNNHVDNLEWCTASHNMRHAQHSLNRKMGRHKLSDKDVEEIKYLSNINGLTHTQIAQLYNVCRSTISKTIQGVLHPCAPI